MKTSESNREQKPRNRGDKRQSQEGNLNGSPGDRADFDCRIAMVDQLSRTLVRHGRPPLLGSAVEYGEWTANRMEQIGEALRRSTREGKTQPRLGPAGKILCDANRLLFENTFDVLTLVLLRTTTEGVRAHASRFPVNFRKCAANRLDRAAAYMRGILQRHGAEASEGRNAVAA